LSAMNIVLHCVASKGWQSCNYLEKK